MRHLSDGALRRLYDEPAAIPAAARRHYATCARCRGRSDTIVADARAAATLLAVGDVHADRTAAFTQIRQRIAAESGVHSRRWHQRWYERVGAMVQLQLNGRRLARPVGGAIVAAALVGALALTPVGSLAQSFITIFEPQQFVAVPVTPGEMQSLPNLQDYGTMTQSAPPEAREVASAAAAAAASGLAVRIPASLPAGVPMNATYTVLSQGTASFTFSAARAQAAAAATGKTLPPMPAGLDGSTLQATIGPAIVATYGGNVGISSGDTTLRGRHAGIKDVVTGRAAVQQEGDIPSLVVAEAAQPRIRSTGATAQEIEDYLLEQPGVSPQLAAEIKAIGDPATALPIPLPVERATAQTVQVQGVSGLAVGDNTGLGSGVIWEKDGVVYGVAGALPESQILAIANSLQ
jgi:hypothetical protein